MAALLLELKDTVDAAKDAGQATLTPSTLARYRRRYRTIIAAGYARNPEPERTGKRGRPRQGKARSLLLRLDQHETDVLRFAHDFDVPFDNNQAEVRHERRRGIGCRRSDRLMRCCIGDGGPAYAG